MKTVLANVQFQFDLFNIDDKNKELQEQAVSEFLSKINGILQDANLPESPVIFVNNISSEDIEIATPEDEDEE